MDLVRKNKKQKQVNADQTKNQIKQINANVLIRKLATLNQQAKATSDKRNQYSKAVEQLNVQLLAFGGAIEQIELILQESGLNIETVYQRINAEIAQKQNAKNENAQAN